MNKKKVLVLAEYGWRNGGENSLLAVVPSLRQKGWEFVFGCPGATELSASLKQNEIDHVDWNVFDENGVRKSQGDIRCDLAELIEQQRPAILHANSLSTGRLAGPVALASKVPSIGYLRDIIKLSRQAITDLNQLDQVIAVSQATRDFHVAQGLKPERACVIYNGVDLEQFSPCPATGFLHQELGIGQDGKLVLCIGQIGLRKGTDTVIQSFLQLCEHWGDLQLLLIGMRNSQKQESIEFEDRCHQIANESKYASQVHWLGRRNDVDRIFNECHLLLHGAKQEPLGRVLLEASASGCPFVATRVGGTAEIVRNCYPELLLCDAGAVNQMTQSAKKILSQDETWSSIRRELRANAETAFCNKRCAEDLHRIYQQMTADAKN